jgi:imidazolonepropionase-like amidohydrolase
VGTLKTGKEADLLVVDGDPLADITVLQKADRLNLVVKAGAPVAGTWTEPGFPAIAARATNAQA